jgi:hypothetical protein
VRGLLAEIRTVPEAREAVAAAKAVQIYAQETKASAAILGLAFRVRSLAKRRLGMVVVREKAAGRLREGRPEKTVLGEDRFSLADLGISKNESAQAQEFASVSETEFERILDEAGSGELNERALLRRIRATRAKTDTSTSNIDKPSGDGESAPTVPGQSAGPVSLEMHVDLVSDELERVVGEFKRGSFAPLKEAARGNERLAGALERFERDFDGLVVRLRGYRSIAS